MLISAWKICKQYVACDANNVTLLSCFANNLPKTVREELFRDKILSDYASDIY